MKQEKILRFIRQELPDNEKEEVLNWIEASEKNQAKYNSIKNAWGLSQFSGVKKGSYPSEKYRELRKIIQPSGTQLFFRISQYAAAFIIIAATGFLVNHLIKKNQDTSVSHEYIVPDGQFANIRLADGTEVYLNSGSILNYGSDYSRTNREVYLSGEAFFKVTNENKHSFIVRTSDIDVVVKGTNFNVNAYPELSKVNVTLLSGKVSIMYRGNGVASLAEGQNLSFNRNTRKMKIANVNTSEYVSWREGIATFKNENLEEISKLLERWYDVDIVFAEDSLKDIVLTGTVLKDKPIDYIIESLKITSDIKFSIIKNQDKVDSIILMTKKNNLPMN